MSVNVTTKASTLRINVITSIDADGAVKYQNRDFRGLKAQASHDEAFQLAQSLLSLMRQPLHAIERIDVNSITSAG
ncbi:DUF1659 domain-containing protein [Heliorestis acidaminivorans]|uniref:DUF1659 domain-containing protein n=1 Tax=Heliorestis acidaminivorans TaxID=553427 RepID=A0A6I0F0P5_9FIRM|nr:DUF1659 domain-containing protein [Heliorestis acidaminivorans]KAB2951659.1 DUF1659 domain-containing protein [Heliorestis acidaminivorans]